MRQSRRTRLRETSWNERQELENYVKLNLAASFVHENLVKIKAKNLAKTAPLRVKMTVCLCLGKRCQEIHINTKNPMKISWKTKAKTDPLSLKMKSGALRKWKFRETRAKNDYFWAWKWSQIDRGRSSDMSRRNF